MFQERVVGGFQEILKAVSGPTQAITDSFKRTNGGYKTATEIGVQSAAGNYVFTFDLSGVKLGCAIDLLATIAGTVTAQQLTRFLDDTTDYAPAATAVVTVTNLALTIPAANLYGKRAGYLVINVAGASSFDFTGKHAEVRGI